MEAALDKKALDLVVMDLNAAGAFTDYFVVCTGQNARQVQAIADAVETALKARKLAKMGHELYDFFRGTAAQYARDAMQPGSPGYWPSAYETAETHGTTSLLVTEDEVLAARRFLWQRVRVLAEPGASVALASVMAGKVDAEPGATLVVVVSGGNNPAIP